MIDAVTRGISDAYSIGFVDGELAMEEEITRLRARVAELEEALRTTSGVRNGLLANPVWQEVVAYFERFCARLDPADAHVCETEIELLARMKAQTED